MFDKYKPRKVTAQGGYLAALGSTEKTANLTSKIDVWQHIDYSSFLFNGQELLYNLAVAIAGLSDREYANFYSNEQYGFEAGE